MRKALSMLAMLLLVTALSFAQQTREVTGKVIDEKGEPVPFASVSIKGSKGGGTANADGTFSIRAKDGDILVISSQKSRKEVGITSSNVGTVVLERVVQTGEMVTVVTTALGVQRQPEQLAYSITRVSGAELTKAKTPSFQNGLQGKVSGLNVQNASNGVTGDTRILLRGIRSLTGENRPLLVLDGTPLGIASSDLLNTINPNDITDVNIIKGNTGAGVYGQDGANGVLVITTRKGVRNKPVINIGSTIQFDKVSYYTEIQDQYGNGEAEDPNGNPIYWGETNNAFGDRFDGSLRQVGATLQNNSVLLLPYKSQLSDRLKFWNTGVTFQKDVSLSTGDDNSRFYMSVQDVTIDGVKPKDESRRTSFRMNASRDFNRLKAGFNINYIQGSYDINVDDTRGAWAGENSVATILWQIPVNIPISMLKDYKNNPFAAPDGYVGLYTKNPYMQLDNNRQVRRTDALIGNIDLSYRISPWLSAQYRLGVNVDNLTQKTTRAALLYGAWAKANRGFADFRPAVADNSRFRNTIRSEFFLNAKKKLNDFSIDVLLGNSVRQSYQKGINLAGNNLVIPTLFNVSNRTGEPIGSEGILKYRVAAFFGKATIGYKEFAYLDFGSRYEQDSRLPINANDFNYPSAGLSLVLHKAIPSLAESRRISYLKVRGSYAKSGNVNLLPYELESTYTVAGTGTLQNFPFGTLPGYSADNLNFDPNIKPEFVETKEVGLEIGFNKNKIMLEATGYITDNTNQIIQIRTSSATGFTGVQTNAAAFQGKGIELDLRLSPLVTIKDFSMDLKLNYTLQETEITQLYPGLDEIGIGTNTNNFGIVGFPAFVFKLVDYKRDAQGRVIVDRNTGLPSRDPSLKRYGRTMPKDLFGANFTANYKNFALSVSADYKGGHYIFHGTGGNMDFGGQGMNTIRFGRERFVFPNSVYEDPANPGKYIPNTNVLTNSGNANFWTTGDNFINIQTNYLTSAASWKIREIVLSYNVPSKALGNGKVIKAATIALTGRNMFMFRPKTNWYADPDFNFSSGGDNPEFTRGGNAMGIYTAANYLPSTRTMGFSINLTF
ncbi:MAG: SusC/RagA family TonB-linked outer membrane protein [Dinghuibacter sp.]|nr:SusC/RagA family TonB-linked outer membrane protein [Dinghuibacter sp.]